MNTNLRKIFGVSLFLCIFLVFSSSPVSASTRNSWWYTLEQGKHRFRQGAYGDALLHFEDARRQRRAMYEQMERDVIDLLSLMPVRRLADSLARVDEFAREQRYDRAAAALDEAYFRFAKADFNDSAQALLTALGNLKQFPEAEYWIGETYRIEGEVALAISQFQKAWEHRELLEQKEFGTELLYKIADLRKVRQEYPEMERILLQILEQDDLWSAGSVGSVSVVDSQKSAISAFARNAMTNTLEKEGVGRFLTLYRYTNTQVEQAHRLLGLYYYATGRHYLKAQEHLMYAFLIQSSIILEEVIRKEPSFSFSGTDTTPPAGMEALAARINHYPVNQVIAEYIDRVEYYKTAYYLACSLYGNNKNAIARELWAFLAAYAPAGEWQNRARSQLIRPQVDRAVEHP